MDEQFGTDHATAAARSWSRPDTARPRTVPSAPTAPSSESEARIADIVGRIEGMVRDVVRQANDEAGRLVDTARRERDSILRAAERDAATTATQARRRGDAIVESARSEAASVAEQSERLSREFVSQVQTLLAAQRAATPADGAADADADAEPSAGVNLASGLSFGAAPMRNGGSTNGLRIEPDLAPPPPISREDASRVFLPEATTRAPDAADPAGTDHGEPDPDADATT